MRSHKARFSGVSSCMTNFRKKAACFRYSLMFNGD